MGTLAAIAQGLADNLIERAADVVLKERRTLVLVPRETPFSAIHLENMLRLAQAGAVILPPNPGFYHQPQSVEALVDFIVARILDHLAVPHALMQRWGRLPHEHFRIPEAGSPGPPAELDIPLFPPFRRYFSGRHAGAQGLRAALPRHECRLPEAR